MSAGDRHGACKDQGPAATICRRAARPERRPGGPRGRQWSSSIPQVASEDIIDIGNGRYAHFRRDRRFAQVQVTFTAPEGVDPDPGRELTDQFKELGWTLVAERTRQTVDIPARPFQRA